MSSIAFESKQGEVAVGGRERARMGGLIDDLSWVMHSRGITRERFDLRAEYDDKLRWLYSGRMGSEGQDTFSERLGWVCLIGSDVMRLLCHIHGQCELNGWVHPDDGEWFAGLVEQGLEQGLLGPDERNHYGTWAQVAELARASTTPLISSYSVTDSWPNPALIAQERPDLWTPAEGAHPWDAWEDLSEADQDRIGDAALESCAPRWHPGEWGTHWSALVMGRQPWE